MQTIISVTDAACRTAVEEYAGELARAGLPLQLTQPADDEDAVCIDWGRHDEEPQGDWGDWELEDELSEADGQVGDGGLARLVEHYLQNLRLLGNHPPTAESWLRQRSAAS